MTHLTARIAAAAEWMADQVRTGVLYQDVAAQQIKRRFGEGVTYLNENRNLAIARPVLQEFRRLTSSTAVWEKSSRLWRKRRNTDAPNKRQVD